MATGYLLCVSQLQATAYKMFNPDCNYRLLNTSAAVVQYQGMCLVILTVVRAVGEVWRACVNDEVMMGLHLHY